MDFTAAEASDWGRAVRDASDLVKQISGCERVYAIAFGEGAQHLHPHLIPRHLNEPASKAWAVADLYRDWIAAIEPPLILPLWRRWCNAVDRCSAPRVEAFARLGAVGVLLEIAQGPAQVPEMAHRVRRCAEAVFAVAAVDTDLFEGE